MIHWPSSAPFCADATQAVPKSTIKCRIVLISCIPLLLLTILGSHSGTKNKSVWFCGRRYLNCGGDCYACGIEGVRYYKDLVRQCKCVASTVWKGSLTFGLVSIAVKLTRA